MGEETGSQLSQVDPNLFSPPFSQKLHFRNVYNELQQHRRFNDVIAFQEEVLSRISETIEKKFGRKKPFTCEYNKCKIEIRDQLTLNDHITQEEWPENLEVLLENLEINEDVESDEGPAHSSTSSRASEPRLVPGNNRAIIDSNTHFAIVFCTF